MGDEMIIVFFFFGLFCLIGFVRFLRYKETMAMAERGLVRANWEYGRETVTRGLVLVFLGFALCIGLLPLGGMVGGPRFFGPWMLAGLIPLGIGLALLLSYAIARREDAGRGAYLQGPPGWSGRPGGAGWSGPATQGGGHDLARDVMAHTGADPSQPGGAEAQWPGTTQLQPPTDSGQ